MITLFDGDELVALRLAFRVPVIADEADGAVHRIGTAKREIDMVEIARRAVGEFGSKPDRRFTADVEIGSGIGQLTHLFGCRFDDAVMPVTGIDAPEAGKTVDELVTGHVGDRGAACRFQHPHTKLLMAAEGGDGVHQMGAVQFDQ
ncbi:hypothetical protein D3C78_1204040 [compost metagenome]